MKVKICGLTRDKDIEAVNNSLPDYAGFVFAGEKRRVTPQQAAELKRELDSRIKAVGVFVDEPHEIIEKLCKEKVIDIVQLHGDEDARYISELQKRIKNPIIKAVSVKEAGQVLHMIRLPADYFLFDSYTEGIHGGSGKTLDFSALKEAFHRALPHKEIGADFKYFLAGGIKLDSIDGILQMAAAELKIMPYCVDISSGAETNGKKDFFKIESIVEKIKGK